MPRGQAQLHFGPVKNSELFANHWLERRLPRESEWTAHRADAIACLDRLAKLWRDKKAILTPNLGEPTMEDEWVHPVLDALGWEYVYQTLIHGRRPDYALFDSAASKRAALGAGRQNPDFWTHARVVADAKAWDTPLDRRSSTADREFPPEQIEWYVNNTLVNWGMLTNGRLWRLRPRQLTRNQSRFETYLEVDLPQILELWSDQRRRTGREDQIVDEFLRWYLLATPVAFASIDGRIPLIERALAGSTEYRIAVGGSLRDQVFEALRLCIEGFLSHRANGLDPARDMEACRANAFTLLFRLLFILFAEDRQLLPYRKNDLYTRNRSLTRLHNELLTHLDTIAPRGTSIWQEWGALFELIDTGKASYGVPAYNGGLFDRESHQFLTKHALPDDYALQVLDRLRRAPDPAEPGADPVRVDYRDLAIQHLGNVYEGLLELHPRHASEPMVVVAQRDGNKTVERTIPQSQRDPEEFERTDHTIEAQQVYLETDKGERRASGSYYTPDHIVLYIVKNTLGPLLADIDRRLREEIEQTLSARKSARGGNREALQQKLDRLSKEFDDRVLDLAVLDPAMGSGHFLIRACQFMAEEIATNPYADDPDAATLGSTGDESTLLFWKRRVVERSLFGVDKNPIAVELAKLALWLETVSIDQPLSFLDHHLRHGDSLIGAKLEYMGRLHDPRVGPAALPSSIVEERLPVLLRPLEQIRQTSSATVAQVKAKERLYRRVFEPVRLPFQRAADLWISVFFVPEGAQSISPTQYKQVIDAVNVGPRFSELADEPWFQSAAALAVAPGIDAFHWELEFPEVFLAPGRVRTGKAGFDCIIGNPPYDVLAEKELGRDLSQLKAYIEAMPIYDPSRRGKNNLYKLFICRALDLLADGGRFGFIVPMAVLGDDQAADIRKAMLRVGALTAVEAFPQKDDPTRRVFAEAKLSTAVFVLVKSSNPEVKNAPFTARQHPADRIEVVSPSLRLTSREVSLYDPENGGIVSCSQWDWDIAVRLMTSTRLTRLAHVAESFQGEVNETRDRKEEAISYDTQDGDEVMRGAHVCLYCLREASQGTPVFIRRERFLDGKSINSKAFHHQQARVGFQRKSPQNNFRRLIATPVARGTFLLESISYVPEERCKLPLEIVLALLNSKLCEWFFRMGSTNAMVGEYQFNNLPCPSFGQQSSSDVGLRNAALTAIKDGDLDRAFLALRPALAEPPFGKAVQDVLVDLVKRIIRIEKARGEIARTERSRLDPRAQPLQHLIDRIMYAMAGLTDEEAAGLEARLNQML